jgi:hypothetical protein
VNLSRRLLKQAAMRGVPPVRRLVEERDALRREVERLSADGRARAAAASAVGRASAGAAGSAAHRTDLDYVFVMTYGRSGSTLLQGILNSTPGVLIRGENRGIIYKLHEYHKQALTDAAWMGQSARRKVNPFFGIHDYPEQLALQRMRELVVDTLLRPRPATEVVGFKEIRWYQEDVEDYVDFLRGVFPEARFVVNTRRLEDVARSSWWADKPDALEQLTEIEGRILGIASSLGERAFHVRYDEYAESPLVLKGLFDWLGLPWEETRVREAMEFDYARMPDSPPRPVGGSEATS